MGQDIIEFGCHLIFGHQQEDLGMPAEVIYKADKVALAAKGFSRKRSTDVRMNNLHWVSGSSDRSITKRRPLELSLSTNITYG